MTVSTGDFASLGRRRTAPLELFFSLILASGALVLFALVAAAIALQTADNLSPRQAVDAARLLGVSPLLANLAILHAAAAVLTLMGRHARIIAGVLEAVGAVAAAGVMLLIIVGRDPLAAWRPETSGAASDGIGILAVLTVLYTLASIATLRSARE